MTSPTDDDAAGADADGAVGADGDDAGSDADGAAGSDGGDAIGPSWRLLAVVALCLVALVALATMAPALADSPVGQSGSDDGSGEGSQSSDEEESDGSEDDETDSSEQPGGEGGGSEPPGGGSGTGGGSNPGGGTGSGQAAGGIVQLPDSRDVGGPISQGEYEDAGTALLFVVEAERPAYWRVGSYDTYAGDRWTRSDELAPYESRGAAGSPGRELEQRIWLNRSVRALPAAWRPDDATVEGDASATFVGGGSLRADRRLPPETTYSVRSVRPPTDPERLRDAGTDYDPALERRYTQLPDDTTDRFVDFTDELTAGDETAYDQARTIEQWIRTEKTYSLDSDHDRSRPLFDEVVFEMDTVYCAYAASAMVGMLRSQGVPARYATGYSSGIADDGRYFVTEQHAHAWVEVYFPGEGWVPFDPTPPGERQANNRQAHQEQSAPLESGAQRYAESAENGDSEFGGGPGSGEPGDPLERAEEGDPESVVGETEHVETVAGYRVRRNQSSPTPGSALEVTVLRKDEPVAGVDVAFDGERVGTTGPDGTVVGTVPWRETFTIDVEPSASTDGTNAPNSGAAVASGVASGSGTAAGSGSSAAAGSGSSAAAGSSSSAAVTSGARSRAAAGDAADLAVSPGSGPAATAIATAPARSSVSSAQSTKSSAQSTQSTAQFAQSNAQSTQSNASVEVETSGRVAIRLDSVPLTEATVPVIATIDGEPVPDADVSVDGERRATTDADGTATVDLPSSAGNATIAVERGAIDGQRTVQVRPLRVGPVDGVAVPGATVTLAVTAGETPIADHEVLIDGASAGTTDGQGLVRASLPAEAGDAEVAIRGDDVRATTTLRVAPPDVSVDDWLPLPGRPATVRVEHTGDPVAGAPVAVDGETVATTGEDGTATVELPVADSAQVETEIDGVAGATTVSHLYANAAVAGIAVLGGLLGGLALLVRIARRRGTDVRSEARSAASLLRRALARALAEVRRLPQRLVDLAVRVGRGAGGLAARLGRSASALLDRGFGSVLAVPGLLLGVVLGVARLLDPRRLLAWLRALLFGSAGGAERAGAADDSEYDLRGGPDDSGDAAAEQSLLDLRDVWRAFVRTVSPPRVATRTAGEIGRYAVQKGLPREPVRTVVDAYRDAEYGRTPPSSGRLKRVASAVRSVADDPDVLDGRLSVRDRADAVDGDGSSGASGAGGSRGATTSRGASSSRGSTGARDDAGERE